MSILIPLLILVPLACALVIFFSGPRAKAMGPFGILAALLTLLLSVGLCFEVYQAPSRLAGADGVTEPTIEPKVSFISDTLRFVLPISVGGHPIDWQLSFGADGISALMVLLTGIIGFFTVWLASSQIEKRTETYIALLLVAISMLMGVFLSMDLLSFYIFFEAVLIPLILLIHGWGNGKNPQAASKRFLLFTLAGSIPMVVGLISLAMSPNIHGQPSTVSFSELSRLASQAVSSGLPVGTKDTWAVWLLLLGFGIKLAILPLHTWLPMTYAAAHPNTTSLIASVVAKLGLYGILRIVIPLAPVALSIEAQMVIGTLGAIVIVYGALVALSKDNLREVLAFSSLSHVGFITLGLMSLTREGLGGAALQMFNHGLITAAMFWILSMLEQRHGTISLKSEDRGLAAQYPKLAVLLVFFTLAGAGLPGLNGFVGELLTMTGMMRVCATLVAIAVLGTVLGAWYGLRIVQRLLFGSDGPRVDAQHRSLSGTDLQPREWLPLVTIGVLCLYIGLFPMRTMKLFQPDTDRLAKLVEPVSKQTHRDMDTLVVESTNP
ncbi:MAG: NuoM family protein [Planctomycetota bacterium]